MGPSRETSVGKCAFQFAWGRRAGVINIVVFIVINLIIVNRTLEILKSKPHVVHCD